MAGSVAASRENTALQVVCFGEVLWDFFESRRSKGQGEGVSKAFTRELGGSPANIATGLSRLGVASAMVGGIGFDRFGDALAEHLENDGVSTRFLVRMPNRTGLTFVTRDAEGEPSFLFYRQDTADVSVSPEQVTREMVQAAWVLVGSSTMMSPSSAAATERFLTLAEEAGARIVVDINVREHMWASKAHMRVAVSQLVKRAAIVKGSFADLVALTGRRDILWLADNAPRAAWVVTQGAKGASAIGDHGFVARPSRKAKCVDATGAGDAFMAGVLSVLLAAGAVPGSVRWRDERVWSAALDAGHIMGSKAVSRVGSVNGLVDLDEVRALAKSVKTLPSRVKKDVRNARPNNEPAPQPRAPKSPSKTSSKSGRGAGTKRAAHAK